MNYLDELNEEQRRAVEDIYGPSLVIAGAGSGKTRVLTYRVAHLLVNGISSFSILALTFTNKAADEMKERIARIVGPEQAKYIWMGTFHSIFARILRKEAEKLGYTAKFTIYDSTDSSSVIKKIIKDMQLDDKVYKPGMVQGRISSAKNNLVLPQAYVNMAEYMESDKKARVPRIVEIYSTYLHHCKRADAMDFDDLLLNMNLLFNQYPEVLEKYKNMFSFILVDEYQDTNFSQYVVIKKLADQHKNICVVGDDAQSIYSFRGAKIENILRFRDDYPNYKLYKLEQNYRSTKNIVEAANSVIANNSRQISKKLFSKNQAGEKIKVIKNRNDNEEGYVIARAIQQTVQATGGYYRNHAILYRTNAQSRIFEEVLRNLSIPYRVFGSLSFYQRKEIKDVLAYFRLIVNTRDDEAFRRIINYPARGIGDTTMGKIEYVADTHNLPLWEVVCRLNELCPEIPAGMQKRIDHFINFIKNKINALPEQDPYSLAYAIVKEAGILDDLDYKNNPENISRYENVEALLNSIKEFSDNAAGDGETVHLDQYIETVTLRTNEDREDPNNNNKVALMTIHLAKGLEFDYVYLPGMEEQLFPSWMSMSSQNDLEEERRLFYVALTRARKRVIISYANERYKWGNLTHSLPSRFIRDIDEHYVDMPQENQSYAYIPKINDNFFSVPTATNKTQPTPPQKLVRIKNAVNSIVSASNEAIDYDDPSLIKEGMQVKHARFGTGTVIAIEGTLPHAKALVRFSVEGEKQLLLKFAKLKILVE